MPSLLTTDDFKPAALTCELRYKNAYLIYDRTGQVIEDVRGSFTDVDISASSPQQTSWVSEEGTLLLGLAMCNLTSNHPDKNGEAFAKQCKVFFDAVAHHLQIGMFTRIGLRYVLRKDYKTLDESKAALASTMLVNLKPTKRFNSSDSPIEVLFRWEDSAIGALVRLKAETIQIKATVPSEWQDLVPKLDRAIHVLTVDTDYYTVAPVDREQWNCLEWVPHTVRIIRREIDGILYGGK
jgi:hypothetical protein